MNSFKEQYEEIILKNEKVIREINELESTDVVKKYIDLCKQREEMKTNQKELYKKMKVQEYSSCKHIWINTSRNYDGYYQGCIKCGLNKEPLYLESRLCWDLKMLTNEQRIMYDFINKGKHLGGIWTKISCNLELARAIYSKIKESNPDIDDETARKYFEIALENIRNIKVNDERKCDRAKRLSLNPEFDKWN